MTISSRTYKKDVSHITAELDWEATEGYYLGLGDRRSHDALKEYFFNYCNRDFSLKQVAEIVVYRKWNIKVQHFDRQVNIRAYEKIIEEKADEKVKAIKSGMAKSLYGMCLVNSQMDIILSEIDQTGSESVSNIDKLLRLMELQLECAVTLERTARTSSMTAIMKDIAISDNNRSNGLNI